MNKAFWIRVVLIAASIALAVYCFFFDRGDEMSRMVGISAARFELGLVMVLWCAHLFGYLGNKAHDFTQEEVADILAEAKRSGKR
jgi:hypothetical protein